MKPTRLTLLLGIFISTSLHVSGNCVPIISRTYCIYATLVFFTLYGWLSGLLVGMRLVSSQPLILNIFISTSLHVSGNCVTIISRTYCIYATLVLSTIYGWLFGLLVGMKLVSSQPLILNIFISTSLHVSGNCVPIISRTYCIYTTLVIFAIYGWLFGLMVGDETYQEDRWIEFSSVQSNWSHFYMPFSCNISNIFMLCILY